MEVVLIGKKQVRKELTMNVCIKLMEEAFLLIAKGDADQPLRQAMVLPDRSGLLGMMPSYSINYNKMGIKIVSVFSDNHSKGLPSHMGVVLLFDNDTGKMLAIIDGEEITTIRTAAASALATNYMANKSATKLAILGAGVQGKEHIEAISCVRSIEEVVIWSRSQKHAEDLKSSIHSKYNFAIRTEADITKAVKKAEIICTTTSATEPLINLKQVTPGVHINAVGSCTPNTRELASDLVSESHLFTDNLESLMNEAGDYLIPLQAGEINENHVKGILSDVVTGFIKGRTSEHDITIYESLGIGVEDLVVGNFLHERAVKNQSSQKITI